MKQFILVLIATLCGIYTLLAQTHTITGTIVDKKSREPLPFNNVLLLSPADSSLLSGTTSDEYGRYTIMLQQAGNYLLKIAHPEYDTYFQLVRVKGELTTVTVELVTAAKTLDEVVIEHRAIRVEQKGDTTQYNADAFKTAPDASVQDLITKMPGITLENGVVKAQGEQITKVFIDGEEFFGDDAAAALKNLPAEIVSKVQVYDNASEQAKFTGISDGNEAKALNIVTKPGKNQGQFGKVYAGYGAPNELYLAGANVNFFKNKRRISLIGLSNNVNQQNFSSEDILGVTGTTANAGGPRGGRGGGGGQAPENFLVGQQNGISTTHALGINYSDRWGKAVRISGSYFFNGSQNNNEQLTNRTYIVSESEGQLYDEIYTASTTNYNHRLNAKLDVMLDSMNTLVITPRVSVQQNTSRKLTDAFTQNSSGTLINALLNETSGNSLGITASNSVLWRHRFAKPQRTLSINLSGNYSGKNGENGQLSSSRFYDENGLDSLRSIDQLADNTTRGYGTDVRFSYTEPLGTKWTGEFFYAPSYTLNAADKYTNDRDLQTQNYALLDTSLSNVFDNKTISNETGANFRFNKAKVNMQLGASYQHSLLLNEQEFPTDRSVRLVFNNVLPNARFRYEFSKTLSLMLNYRTGTRNPSVDQLQNVINNSNPLSLSSGNPELKQQYNHTVFARLNATNTKKASNFFVLLYGQLYSNYITNATVVAGSDTTLEGGVALLRGSQYTKPVNLNGSWNSRTTVSYGIPLVKLKVNLNVFAGAGYTVTTALINEAVNASQVTNTNVGTTIASNISDKIDFTINYQFNYNGVVNTQQSNANNNYAIHNVGARFNWIIKERLVINSNYALNAYAGLGSEFNQTIMLWNGGVGYRFLKNKQLEARISVFDILNNNNSIARNVTQTYIEDVASLVLNRYYMFTMTYSLRNFGSKALEEKRTERPDYPERPIPGSRQ